MSEEKITSAEDSATAEEAPPAASSPTLPPKPKEPVDPKPPKLNFDAAGDKKPAEQWATIKQTPNWLFQATRVGLQWPKGQEMTEADYDAGITWAAHAPCR